MNTPLLTATAAATGRDDPTLWRVDDDLWALLAPVLKSEKARKKPGRPGRDDRAIVDGLIWLARTGAQWSQLPRVFGPKSTVHERFSEWVETGALERSWVVLLREYDGAIGLDWSWQAAALRDGTMIAPAPPRPPHLAPDRGDDYAECRAAAAMRGYAAHIPLKGTEAIPLPPPGHPDRHPLRRGVVEAAHSWFNRFRRLLTRTEQQARHYLGFSHLAAVLSIYRKVRHVRLLSG